MSEEELNSYRLTSMEEPTDEMLAQIMREAAQQAKAENEAAHKAFFEKIERDAISARKRWNEKWT